MLVGIVLVVGSSSALGLYFCYQYKQRLNELRELQKAMICIQSEMKYGRMELDDIFEQAKRCTKGCTKGFFQAVQKRRGHNFQQEWKEAVEREMACLARGEKDNLNWLGSMLGMQDLEAQLLQIEQYKKRTERQIQELENEQKKYVKLYPALGVCLGMIVCLMLVG